MSEAGSLRLESLVPNLEVEGIVHGKSRILSLKWYSPDAVVVTYQTDSGAGTCVLTRENEGSLRLADQTSAPFDADPREWRLAAEAVRLREAAHLNPMLGVTTSNLQPLPHQLRAVYEDMLPQSPLRYLLADDPGAGKTIMCGLLIKELVLRGALNRCLIVAPGSLVGQWQQELFDKFNLTFDVLSHDLIQSTREGTVFDRYPLMIARMDQLSRREDLIQLLERSDWDLVVVDEAHRMSATRSGEEVRETKRFQLGKLLGQVARNFLLMTATPHAGIPENFELFLSLLDPDRFVGRPRGDSRTINTDGLMGRRVKEELLTMEGTPLFPERRAYTVPYDLTAAELKLYEEVTQYVRDEMNRADRLRREGETRRGNTVGFALTVLQRRLASSPEAILRSLERRRNRLGSRRDQVAGRVRFEAPPSLDLAPESLDDVLVDLESAELEALETDTLDAASAARTLGELEHEIKVLDGLVTLAHHVRALGTDRKWTELKRILSDEGMNRGDEGRLRKLIIFTEHRDTLRYLLGELTRLLDDEDAVVCIHGGLSRDERRAAQDAFTGQDRVRVLVATDAAGEGINLQCAHLMVNYDLPWNPNRIEQRFGRIHRIGQTEVCHLWNLVANQTREGAVFLRLLEKIDEQQKSYGGRVFDVLGEPFVNAPLRDLLVKAIRYGNDPQVRARLEQVIDEDYGAGLEELLQERALSASPPDPAEADRLRPGLERARAFQVQPHFVEHFFLPAFDRLHGRMASREKGFYQVTHVPDTVRTHARHHGMAPVLAAYERVTFDPHLAAGRSAFHASLLTLGHPLLDAVVSMTAEGGKDALRRGAVFVDTSDAGSEPHLMVAVTDRVKNGRGTLVGRRHNHVNIWADGRAADAGPAPFLDYTEPEEAALRVAHSTAMESWLLDGGQELAVRWAIQNSTVAMRESAAASTGDRLRKTRTEVWARMTSEIAHWEREAALGRYPSPGRTSRIRPDTADRRAAEMRERLATRMAELDAEEHLSVAEPHVASIALVIPSGALLPRPSVADVRTLAINRVSAIERAQGAVTTTLDPTRDGVDIRSNADAGLRMIRVFVRYPDGTAPPFRKTDALVARNLGDHYRAALVDFVDDPAGALRYVEAPFSGVRTTDFHASALGLTWQELWRRGRPPSGDAP